MSNLKNPLEIPKDPDVLHRYLSFFGIDRNQNSLEILRSVIYRFGQLPYENLTKIIKQDLEGSHERARRFPDEVIKDHIALGAGGTCFSLTAALLHLVRALGWRAEPIMADRKYGDNTHCAMIVWIDERPCLVDPGYLLLTPVDISVKDQSLIQNPFNAVKLIHKGADKLDLYTLEKQKETYRLTFKTNPADTGEFLTAWDNSFDWDMMNYPLLTRVFENEQIYLRGERLQFRSAESVKKSELRSFEMCAEITRLFHINERIVHQAVDILKRKKN